MTSAARLVVRASLAAVLVCGVSAQSVSRDHALDFQKKLDQIVARGERADGGAQRTSLSEAEVNSYLRYSTGDRLPVGVTDPSIGIHAQGKLSGRAIVDLDVIRRRRSSGGWFDPLSYLTGRLPLTAEGTLQTHAGQGKFTLDGAAISGIPIPKILLQEIVSHYTRTADLPAGISIDEPFTLPADIDRIDVEQGRAFVVQ